MSDLIERRRENFKSWVKANGGVRTVAKKANVSEQTLYSYISLGRQSMTGATQEKIASAYGVEVGAIFGRVTDGIYPIQTPFREVPIRGEVRAGAWISPAKDLSETAESLPFADPDLVNHDLAAWTISATSDQGPYPAGSYVIVDIAPNQIFRIDDHVIVIRTGWQGLMETTIKEVDLIDDIPTLRDCGKGPIWTPTTDETWEVMGLIVRTYQIVKPKSTRLVRF